MSNDTCSIDGCANPAKSAGLCWTHYDRKRKGADLYAPVGARFSTTEDSFKGRIAPDSESGCLLWTGSTTHNGYGRLWVGTKNVRAHRYAWERVNGPIPEGLVIDHMCWNRACVNVEHMRLLTAGQNQQNRQGAQDGSKSGLRNVYLSKDKSKWRVSVRVSGKDIHGGYFTDKEEAARVAAEMRAELLPYSQN